MTIDYNVSLRYTKNLAKHKTPSQINPNSEIIIYLPNTTNYAETFIQKNIEYMKNNFPDRENAFFNFFTLFFIDLNLLERICLECRLNNKVRIERGLGKIENHGKIE